MNWWEEVSLFQVPRFAGKLCVAFLGTWLVSGVIGRLAKVSAAPSVRGSEIVKEANRKANLASFSGRGSPTKETHPFNVLVLVRVCVRMARANEDPSSLLCKRTCRRDSRSVWSPP